VFFSVYFSMSDRIHTKVLNDCYKNGRRLEEEIGSLDGLYHLMAKRVDHSTRRWWLTTYRVLLQVLFIVLGIGFAFGAVATVIWGGDS
jgi:hypothetical protein